MVVKWTGEKDAEEYKKCWRGRAYDNFLYVQWMNVVGDLY
jgi:hypothetical protein